MHLKIVQLQTLLEIEQKDQASLAKEILSLNEQLTKNRAKNKEVWKQYNAFNKSNPEREKDDAVERKRSELSKALDRIEKKYYKLIGRRNLLCELMRQNQMVVPKEGYVNY